jgi:hypothetical protein
MDRNPNRRNAMSDQIIIVRTTRVAVLPKGEPLFSEQPFSEQPQRVRLGHGGGGSLMAELIDTVAPATIDVVDRFRSLPDVPQSPSHTKVPVLSTR